MNESEQMAGAMAIVAGMGIFFLVFFLVIHLFFGYCFKMIAEKTGNNDVAGLWWIPLANIWIPVKIAGKPMSWVLGMLFPMVISILSAGVIMAGSPGLGMILNLVAMLLWIGSAILWVMVWMNVAEARGFERWWGLIAVFVSIVGIPYIAFAESKSAAPAVNI